LRSVFKISASRLKEEFLKSSYLLTPQSFGRSSFCSSSLAVCPEIKLKGIKAIIRQRQKIEKLPLNTDWFILLFL
jgi:hypothetical protein